ncbi:hypothetical protein OIE66_22415 [Nonomuraea sp. NBC_01738]|uniref:hypothetical protein n=1 Tax=Nonomuraea sp. NBC_01738 TaxID=2976003 RepID=UPI002E0D7477|nr:hypothetical protein OIE66_22415 [Nonomuraea sp. NBC_01738]
MTAGAVTGFAAGLVADLIPPAGHPIGRTALVLCLAGYATGHLRGRRALLAMPAGIILGLGLSAGAAALTGARITEDALTHVLPLAALYGAALAPLPWYLVRLKAPDANLPPARDLRADRFAAAHPAHPPVGRAGTARRLLRQGGGGRPRAPRGRAAGAGRDPR